MSDVFEKLRNSSPQSGKPRFANALLGPMPAFFSGRSEGHVDDVQEDETTPSLSEIKADEKTQVLHGLKKFTEEKLEEAPKIVFPGGEIGLKPAQNQRRRELNYPFSSQIKNPLCDLTPATALDLTLFIGETLKEEQKLMLTKMIQAMKIGDHRRLAVVEEEAELGEWLENVLLHIAQLKPKVVVCLGALVTNLLLGEKERLSRIHGQFFAMDLVFSDGIESQFQFVPIFHPEFLLINPKMKEATWNDLKKIMSFLNS